MMPPAFAADIHELADLIVGAAMAGRIRLEPCAELRAKSLGFLTVFEVHRFSPDRVPPCFSGYPLSYVITSVAGQLSRRNSSWSRLLPPGSSGEEGATLGKELAQDGAMAALLVCAIASDRKIRLAR